MIELLRPLSTTRRVVKNSEAQTLNERLPFLQNPLKSLGNFVAPYVFLIPRVR